MSRAFLDESSQSHEEDVPELKIPLPSGARNYMTPEGAARLRAELADLSRVQRPRLAAELAHDPAPSNPLRRRLREVDRRIEYLLRMMALLEVIEPGSGPAQRVSFGVEVTVLEEGGGERRYRIVGVDEADPERGSLSWISPVARALVGKKVGDTVEILLPEGSSRLRVQAIAFPSD